MQPFYQLFRLLLIPVLMGLTSCSTTYPYATRRGILNDIPTIPHQQPVAVYFPGEYPEDDTYVKVRVLEVGGANDYPSLVDQLKREAQITGMDGLLMLEKSEKITDRGIAWNFQGVETSSTLSAVGIKYLRNLHYLDHYVRQQHIAVADSSQGNQFREKFTYTFDLTGVPTSAANLLPVAQQQLYRDYVERYALKFLLYDERSDWTHARDEMGRVKTRNYRQGLLVSKLHYDGNGKISFIRLRFPSQPGRLPETLRLHYNDQQLVAGLVAEKAKKPFLREQLTYDERGRLIRREVFRIRNGQELPFLRIDQEYYTQEYALQQIRSQP